MLYRFRHFFEMKRLIKNGLRVGKRAILFNAEEDYGYNTHLVSIGDNCVVASGVKFITLPGIIPRGCQEAITDETLTQRSGIVVKDNCFIGINAIIYPGVEIGPNAVVGAGAVVMDNVQPDRCVAGNPAKVTCTLQFYERICTKNETLHYNHKSKRSVLQQYFWTSRNDKLHCQKA